MSEGQGYYRQPAVAKNQIIFVSETDLWSVPLTGGRAIRLTAHQVDASWPLVTPDGGTVVFSAWEEGAAEVYAMPAEGGAATRLTFQGSVAYPCGFTSDGKSVLFSSIADSAFARVSRLWSVPLAGGSPVLQPLGPVRRYARSPGGAVAITRREQEIARWKRYKGGTKGDLWIDRKGDGKFAEVLKDLDGNLGSPCFAGERLYFVADHEGHGNIYSIKTDGKDLKRHTNHTDFYARALATDGKTLVYQCGAEIWTLDAKSGANAKVPIQINSTRPHLTRKFVSAARYLQGFALHPDGHSLVVTTRGKSFVFGNWEREVVQLGTREGVRYRHTQYLPDGKSFVTISDEGGEDGLEVHTIDPATGEASVTKRLDKLDLGHVRAMTASPAKNQVVCGNHRCEIILVDIDKGKATVLDKANYEDINAMRFSPDGKYVAYSATKILPFAQIFIADTEGKGVHAVSRAVGSDYSPSWDPDGKYLYFLSARTFDPVYDTLRFDLGFPKGVRPYVVTLRKDLESPFSPQPKPLEGAPPAPPAPPAKVTGTKVAAKKTKAKAAPAAKKPEPPKPIVIDFDGIEDRILEVPVPEARYERLAAVKGKIFFSETPIEGSLGKNWMSDRPASRLHVYDFDNLKTEVFLEGLTGFTFSRDGKTMVYRGGGRLRVIKTGAKPDAKETRAGRASGYVDLDRLRVAVTPAAEWKQMYREIWRLQRDHFWDPKLSNVDWKEAHKRYLPVLDRVSTRSEFSDLAWELQGELGTSHAYEIGGDLRSSFHHYPVGKLGADFSVAKDGSVVIDRVVRGDSWDRSQDSPLGVPGANVQPGDKIVAVDGQKLAKGEPTLPELLLNKAGADVALLIAAKDGKKRKITVKPLGSDFNLRYRHWVESNRSKVHAATKGRVGYVHVPDMGPRGYSEFFRYYVTESYRDGLIVDVRFNGGGHVSQFLLEKLQRKRLSYMVSHHMKPFPEPHYSVDGPIICVTNEHAGSDGDIFSHSFKMLKLGTLIGTRTWGGVIGIDGRNHLVDGTVVTQPEYSTWFKDVGWGVENYGTDPDIEVDIAPQDYAAGEDPQLVRAIALALESLTKNPPLKPDFDNRPSLARPAKLP